MHDDVASALARHATVRWNGAARPPGAVAIVDIDGVLADTSARQQLLERPGGGRDWDAFFAAAGDDLRAPVAVALLTRHLGSFNDDVRRQLESMNTQG